MYENMPQIFNMLVSHKMTVRQLKIKIQDHGKNLDQAARKVWNSLEHARVIALNRATSKIAALTFL